jgi:hypothetical protein
VAGGRGGKGGGRERQRGQGSKKREREREEATIASGSSYNTALLFPPLPPLRRELYNNALTSLDVGLFDKNTALRQLYVDWEFLDAFDPYLSSHPHSRSLHYNQLTSLPSGVFLKNTALQQLYVD